MSLLGRGTRGDRAIKLVRLEKDKNDFIKGLVNASIQNCNIDAIVIGKCTVFFYFVFYSQNIYILVF